MTTTRRPRESAADLEAVDCVGVACACAGAACGYERSRAKRQAGEGRRVIPPAVLERGERAIVGVLRRRFPYALFEVRDAAVSPDDPNVALEVGAGSAANVDAAEEAGENVSPLGGREAVPQFDQRPAQG